MTAKKKIHIITLFLFTLIAGGCQTTNYPPKTDRYAVSISNKSEVLVLYVAANDCPYCARFEINELVRFKASSIFEKVQYREVHAMTYHFTDGDQYWPEDLRWIKKVTYAESGVPRFIVAVDGTIVENKRGTKHWEGTIIPTVEVLLARRG